MGKATKEQRERLILNYHSKGDNALLSDNKLAQLIITKERLDYTADWFRKEVKEARAKFYSNKQSITLDISDKEDNFGINIPSEYEGAKIIELPKTCDNILILNDIHVPYHIPTALNIALKYGRDNSVNTIILNGDIADFTSLSQFDRLPKQRDFETELSTLKNFLRQLRALFPNAKIYYKFGNHEDRFDRYLLRHSVELYNVSGIRLEAQLELNSPEINMGMVGSTDIIKAGKIFIAHGHEFDNGGGINVARQRLLKAFTNIISGHSHQSQTSPQNILGGEPIASYAIGCLCGLEPRWKRINNWSHGFGHLVIDNDGSETMKNFRISNGKIKEETKG